MTSKQLVAGVVILALVVVAAGVLVVYKAPAATTPSTDSELDSDLESMLQDLDSSIDLDNFSESGDAEAE
jgi:hypothetical protein